MANEHPARLNQQAASSWGSYSATGPPLRRRRNPRSRERLRPGFDVTTSPGREHGVVVAARTNRYVDVRGAVGSVRPRSWANGRKKETNEPQPLFVRLRAPASGPNPYELRFTHISSSSVGLVPVALSLVAVRSITYCAQIGYPVPTCNKAMPGRRTTWASVPNGPFRGDLHSQPSDSGRGYTDKIVLRTGTWSLLVGFRVQSSGVGSEQVLPVHEILRATTWPNRPAPAGIPAYAARGIRATEAGSTIRRRRPLPPP